MHRVRTWARAKAHGHPGADGQSRPTSAVVGSPTTNNDPAAVGETAQGLDGTSTMEKPPKPNIGVRFLLTMKSVLFHSWINILLVFVPVGIAVNFTGHSAGIVFAMNAIAIVPLAGLLSHSTEVVAASLGDAIGALMNITFGNAVELIIFIALVKNEIRIVQASLLGSILANLLLILGMSFFLGGLRFREQIYNSTVTQTSACLLCLAVMSLLLPTAFHASFQDSNLADAKVLQVSRGVSVILLLVYGLYLVFQLNSHAYMYESTPQHIIEAESAPGPAVAFFDTSSDSSDADTGSSSGTDSSSSDSGPRKKMKRVIRGKMRRKHSENSGNTSDDQGQSNKGPPGVSGQEDGEGSRRPKKAHSKRQKRGKHTQRANTNLSHRSGNNVPARESSANDAAGQVGFVVAPDLEAQVEPSSNAFSKPFPLRHIRPTLPIGLSQNVFTKPRPIPDPQAPGGQSRPSQRFNFADRRTMSMPDQINRAYRLGPGEIPRIVPVVVGGGAKTQTKGEEKQPEELSRTSAVLLLLVSTALVAVCAEFMVDSINDVVAGNSGISEAFIGLILLPIVGNAAEHVTGVTVAMKNKMDLAIGVALGSSIQIAIFVTPLVVILGWILNKDMSLFFTLFETVSLFVSTFIVNFLVLDGRSNYLEGALLMSAYIIIAVAAFFYPSEEAASQVGGGNVTTDAITEAAGRFMVRGMTNLVAGD